MGKIKSRREVEAQQAFIRGTKDDWRIADWSPDSLKYLSIVELEDQWQAIEHQTDAIIDQAKMMIWHICLRIREMYPSDKLMGEYLSDLKTRNPAHPLSVGSTQQTRNKWANAARWCNEMNIKSLPEVGLTQQAVFILSAPTNKDIAKQVFQEIKQKHVPSSVIERRIAELKAVATIEKVDVVDYKQQPTPLKVVLVEDNTVVEPEIVQAIEAPVEIEKVAHTAFAYPVLPVKEIEETENTVTDERINEVMDFVGKYQLSLMDLILLFKGCIEVVNRLRYPKG